jgi:hypothetical protein
MDGWTVILGPETFFGLFPLDDDVAPPDDPWEMFEARVSLAARVRRSAQRNRARRCNI